MAALVDELEFREHEDHPEEIGNTFLGIFCAEDFMGDGDFELVGRAGKGGEVKIFDQAASLENEFGGTAIQVVDELGSVVEFEGLEGGEIGGSGGDHLFAIGASEGAHEEGGIDERGADAAGEGSLLIGWAGKKIGDGLIDTGGPDVAGDFDGGFSVGEPL